MKLSKTILGPNLTKDLLEHTAGQFFITGTSIQELTQNSEKSYKRHGLGSIADYSLEGLIEYDEKVLEESKNFMIKILEDYCRGRPYCDLAVKFTGFTTLDVCKELNDIQFKLFKWFENVAGVKHASHRKFDDFITKEGILKYFQNDPQITENDVDEVIAVLQTHYPEAEPNKITRLQAMTNLYAFDVRGVVGKRPKIFDHLAPLGEDLSKKLADFDKRTRQFLEKAKQIGANVYVDAEQSYLQLMIDPFVRQYQEIYHEKDKKAFIMNGYQSYYKFRRLYMELDVQRCKHLGIGYGVKLVRGAYINQEREYAKTHGRESPCWENIEETHKMYNSNVDYLIENLDERSLFCLASHNIDSIARAIELKEKYGISNENLVFAQLQGMSDHVSVGLSRLGHRAIKYRPFGPYDELIPYLQRRAQEAKQVSRELEFQKRFIFGEIKRRLS